MQFNAGFAVLAVAIVLAQCYDYCEVLRKSLLFYQAQRSGYLSGMAPELWWRGDSAVDDRGVYGEDLEGGYYDDGGHVKFGFPLAYSLTTLAWGLLEFEEGYNICGQLEEGRQALLWGIKYLRKAHNRPDRLYGQVGVWESDHNYWGRPECMTMERPAFYIDPSRPGSDLAAESAAAFAAAALVFRQRDPALSSELLERARELYAFANYYRGKYSDSITNAASLVTFLIYPLPCSSYSYEDELVWGATWLARATGDPEYVQLAQTYYADFGMQWYSGNYGWDTKVSGVHVQLAQLTADSHYRLQLQSYCDYLLYSQQRTPRGLVFLGQWGTLRNTANAVFICAQAAKLNVQSAAYWSFVKQQIDYMLGDAGRSFVVGFGVNPPQRPRHRGSSCLAVNCTCNWYALDGPNPHVLYGALVGGPDENDYYSEDRGGSSNEVALDYNAAFQGVVAALAERY